MVGAFLVLVSNWNHGVRLDMENQKCNILVLSYFHSLHMAKAKSPKKELQHRGLLTQRIKDKSKEMMGYEINQKELRLIPYVQYVMMNEQHLDMAKVDSEEREIISKWREKGYIEGGASQMRITREFWEILCEICFLGYVDII